eukprot:scaffold122834_cov75-Phaeocystis_antarctica.AAC.2
MTRVCTVHSAKYGRGRILRALLSERSRPFRTLRCTLSATLTSTLGAGEAALPDAVQAAL